MRRRTAAFSRARAMLAPGTDRDPVASSSLRTERVELIDAPIDHVEASVYVVPTDRRESDGTFAWDRTTVVVAHVFGGGREGLGWTFADAAAARLAVGPLARAV